MKKRIRLFILLAGILMVSEGRSSTFTSFISDYRNTLTGNFVLLLEEPDSLIYINGGFPAPLTNEILINHAGYTLSYNCTYRIANWVIYELTSEETESKVKRKNRFIGDPFLDSCQVSPNDYLRTGFDKGHLAPSADMCWSQQTMEESFYMTNMAPQKPGFNRGIWKNLEDKTRDWAIENRMIVVISGPVLSDNLKTIGKSKVTVPKYFFKVIVDLAGAEIKGIAFVMPNKPSKSDIQSFAVSIDRVEQLTGLDFFFQLPENAQSVIESDFDLNSWRWKGKPNISNEDDN